MEGIKSIFAFLALLFAVGSNGQEEYRRNFFASPSSYSSKEAKTPDYPNRLIVDCLNTPENKGKFLVNTFFADTTKVVALASLFPTPENSLHCLHK